VRRQSEAATALWMSEFAWLRRSQMFIAPAVWFAPALRRSAIKKRSAPTERAIRDRSGY